MGGCARARRPRPGAGLLRGRVRRRSAVHRRRTQVYEARKPSLAPAANTSAPAPADPGGNRATTSRSSQGTRHRALSVQHSQVTYYGNSLAGHKTASERCRAHSPLLSHASARHGGPRASQRQRVRAHHGPRPARRRRESSICRGPPRNARQSVASQKFSSKWSVWSEEKDGAQAVKRRLLTLLPRRAHSLSTMRTAPRRSASAAALSTVECHDIRAGRSSTAGMVDLR